MEHLALEIFDLPTAEDPKGTGSRFATLLDDSTITITDTSEIFASGDVWSHSFTLNAWANAHIFGTAADMHGSRLHDQLDRRRARLWVERTPMYLGYLRLDDEADVDGEGNVDVRFESGQKTFEEMIDGISAQEVSVGDVPIGIALNRKRVSVLHDMVVFFTLDGMDAYAAKDPQLSGVRYATYSYGPYRDVSYPGRDYPHNFGAMNNKTQYVQRWPKLVKSYGEVLDGNGEAVTVDYTNVQTPYDAGHPFCNLNICYQMKVNKDGEEVAGRGYTVRLAHGKKTTDGGDGQTRFNNAPNFYLLHFIDRLFKDMKIHVEENQALDVEDLRRVFLLNYGCFYEEIEDAYGEGEEHRHLTPAGKWSRYGQYYMPIIDGGKENTLIKKWLYTGYYAHYDSWGLDKRGKVLLRDVKVTKGGSTLLSAGSLEGVVQKAMMPEVREGEFAKLDEESEVMSLDRVPLEEPSEETGFYSAYMAYATGENYPKVDISEIIDAMKSMFGVRLLFSNDYSSVRIVLLRNVFRNQDVQDIACEVVAPDTKTENSVRGFRMTYGKGNEDTAFYYKGFNDMFSRAATVWKDTSDKHDYSHWRLDADYDEIKQYISAMNKTCYVTPLTGNAYIIKIDEDEDVLFPSLFEAAGFMDAEDGDCSRVESEGETVEEVQAGAMPVIMNDVDGTFASIFSGDLKAPAPDIKVSENGDTDGWQDAMRLATYGRATAESLQVSYDVGDLTVSGMLDIYVAEGFQMRLLDNYGVGNTGTPFDDADPGLQFGIMRSSGPDASVRYYDDPDDDENDAWEVVPGSGAISHPDTCDDHGNQWTYDSQVGRMARAGDLREAGWSVIGSDDRMVPYSWRYVLHTPRDGDVTFICTPVRYFVETGARPAWDDPYSGRRVLTQAELTAYIDNLWSTYGWDFGGHDPERLVLSAGAEGSSPVYTDGRFSLKLRAEKPNPYFDATKAESAENPRYLEIDDPNLRGRGLMDQFYKEYSYWVRNARIAKRTVRMTLAQLLAIDKTKRVKVGDITGFIRKTQYSVSNKTGLGTVEMEIMYI